MNTLFIDTSDKTKTIVRLKKGKDELEEVSDKKGTRAQVTLLLIEKLLKETGTKREEIDKIKVRRGPGSFTGLRVGISIANALSFGLQVPVNNKKLGELETPEYQLERKII